MYCLQRARPLVLETYGDFRIWQQNMVEEFSCESIFYWH